MQKVSVIMNCLNSTQYLREAIDSVYAQTYSNWEIIIWDNNSTEDVRGFLLGYDNRLRYYKDHVTVSLGEARNRAMSKGKGKLIAFLDCDDIWMPNKLGLCIPHFSDLSVGVVYSNWILFNNNGYEKVKYDDLMAPEGWVFEQILFNNFTCLSTLIFRADIIYNDQIQFDPQFTFLEDTDFLIMVSRKWKFIYEHTPLTSYRMHSESATATKVEGFRREMDILIDKFSALIPVVKEKYEAQLRLMNRRDEAMDNWRKGDTKKARSLIYVNLITHPRYSLLYLAMFLPYRYFDWFRNRLFKKAIGYYY
jgi:glycosyltransferase involved in cell wall biosynthesis